MNNSQTIGELFGELFELTVGSVSVSQNQTNNMWSVSYRDCGTWDQECSLHLEVALRRAVNNIKRRNPLKEIEVI